MERRARTREEGEAVKYTNDFVQGLLILFVACILFQAPDMMPPTKPQESHQLSPAPLRPLREMMPKTEVRSNAPADFQVAFMAYNSTNWCVVSNHFATALEAQSVIDEVKFKLELQYGIAKAIHDRLGEFQKSLTKESE